MGVERTKELWSVRRLQVRGVSQEGEPVRVATLIETGLGQSERVSKQGRR